MTQMRKRPTGPKPVGHGGHGQMMMACCTPMLILAVVLVGIGVLSPSFLLVAIACTAMMALMMHGMQGEKETDPHARDRGTRGP